MIPKIVLLFQTKKNKIMIPITSLIPFPKAYQHGLPETTSLYFLLNMSTSDSFFHPLLLSEISLIIIVEIQNWLVLFKNKSLNLSDHVLIVCLMCIIIMELNYLQDHELG